MEMSATFLGIAATYALLRACRRNQSRYWCLYAVVALVALYTFYYAALVLLAINLALPASRWKLTRGWWLANLAVFIAWIPWPAWTLARAPNFLSDRVAELGPPSPAALLLIDSARLEFGTTASSLFQGAPAVFLLLIALFAGYWTLRLPTVERRMIVAWALLPTIALDFIALTTHVYWPRYWLLALPGWIALVSVGLGAYLAEHRGLFPASLCGLAAFVFLAGTTTALAANYADPLSRRDDYRAAFALVQTNALPDEALVFDPLMQQTAVDYYGQELPLPAVGLPIPLDGNVHPAAQLPPWREDRTGTDAKLLQLTDQYHGFWLLLYNDSATWTEDWLGGHRLLTDDRWFGNVRLEHYRPGPGPASGTLPGGLRVGKDFGPLRLLQAKAGAFEHGRLVVDLLWQATAPSEDLAVSVQLFDQQGQRVAQADGPPLHGALPTSRWVLAQAYPDTAVLSLPAGLRPGAYRLAVSVYNGQGIPAGQQIMLMLPYLDRSAVTSRLDLAADAGWTIDSVSMEADGSGGLLVVAAGSVQSQPAGDYTWFVHLLNAGGQLLAQDDRPPLAAVSSWRPGDRIQEVFRLPQAAGAAQLELGSYDSSGARTNFRLPGGEQDHIQVDLPQGNPVDGV